MTKMRRQRNALFSFDDPEKGDDKDALVTPGEKTGLDNKAFYTAMGGGVAIGFIVNAIINNITRKYLFSESSSNNKMFMVVGKLAGAAAVAGALTPIPEVGKTMGLSAALVPVISIANDFMDQEHPEIWQKS
jgi:hypothetical protein